MTDCFCLAPKVDSFVAGWPKRFLVDIYRLHQISLFCYYFTCCVEVRQLLNHIHFEYHWARTVSLLVFWFGGNRGRVCSQHLLVVRLAPGFYIPACLNDVLSVILMPCEQFDWHFRFVKMSASEIIRIVFPASYWDDRKVCGMGDCCGTMDAIFCDGQELEDWSHWHPQR